jgi:hypothetical protein
MGLLSPYGEASMGLLGICAHPGDQPIEYLNCTHSESQQSVIILLVQPAYKGALLTLETTAFLHDKNPGQLYYSIAMATA